MVTPGTSLHDSGPVRFTGRASHPPNRLCRPGRCSTCCVPFSSFFLTLLVTKRLGFGYKLAATQSFTAASNNFGLAVAVAVATFGANSDEALATTVGPLIEVPVLISLVYVVRWVAGPLELDGLTI